MLNTSRRDKGAMVLILLILAGVVFGGFMGEYLGTLPYMSWLSYGAEFGISEPIHLNLGVIRLAFGLTIKFSIAGILGILLSIFIYKKI